MAASSKDVEMKEEPAEKDPEQVKKDENAAAVERIRGHVRFIERAISSKEPRYISRILLALRSTRRTLNHAVLRQVLVTYFPPVSSDKDSLLAFLDEPMDDVAAPTERARSAKSTSAALVPEINCYLHLLMIIHLIDTERRQDAVSCADVLMGKIKRQSALYRPTMNQLIAKCYFYYARVYELVDRLQDIRPFLHAHLRTATLKHDTDGQACLLNLLLRNYLHYNLFDQAAKLQSKSDFPEAASNNEWARYMYYLGRIQAIQLKYADAHKSLMQAIRKAPQHCANGFKQTAYKLAVTVELLLGDIPDRSIFREAHLRKPLQPYFRLVQAVQSGDLAMFAAVVSECDAQFLRDHTHTLILRLHHNVIKTGVRMINLSYSKISLDDVAAKLQLDSPEEAEYIVAKAIKDGVIEATIDHHDGYVQSKENVDIYSTQEPQKAFHERITFCLELHNQSVKAMRFPPKSYNKDLEPMEERREREQQDLEYAKELAEDEEDGF